jgi:hypothetical protein
VANTSQKAGLGCRCQYAKAPWFDPAKTPRIYHLPELPLKGQQRWRMGRLKNTLNNYQTMARGLCCLIRMGGCQKTTSILSKLSSGLSG